MKRVIFNKEDPGFYHDVKTAVDEYFKNHNLKKTGNWKLYLKTWLFIPLALLDYCYLLFVCCEHRYYFKEKNKNR